MAITRRGLPLALRNYRNEVNRAESPNSYDIL